MAHNTLKAAAAALALLAFVALPPAAAFEAEAVVTEHVALPSEEETVVIGVLGAFAGANWACASNKPTCDYFQAVGFHSSTVPLIAQGTLYLNGAFQDVCPVVALSCGTQGPTIIGYPHNLCSLVTAVTTAPALVPAVDNSNECTV